MAIENTDAEWKLRRKMREAETNASALSLYIGKSRTWAHVQLFKDPLGTLWTMCYKEPEALERFALKLGYQNRYDLLIDLGLITKADLQALQTWTDMPQHESGSSVAPSESRTVKIPVYGPVGEGLKKIHAHDPPQEFMEMDRSELPQGVDPERLFLLMVDGDSMSDEHVFRQIPCGSKVLVEQGAVPEEDNIVVAWIPELEVGVIRQPFSQENNALLRSYKVGGPVFWASRYPDMVLEGVVRQVIWQL